MLAAMRRDSGTILVLGLMSLPTGMPQLGPSITAEASMMLTMSWMSSSQPPRIGSCDTARSAWYEKQVELQQAPQVRRELIHDSCQV